MPFFDKKPFRWYSGDMMDNLINEYIEIINILENIICESEDLGERRFLTALNKRYRKRLILLLQNNIYNI